MLSFKEFVFASWATRSYGPTGLQAEKVWELWNFEKESNGWWKRYKAWEQLGCPQPVKDINYENILKSTMTQSNSVNKPTLTFEEFFVAKMKATAPAINWTFEDHFPKQWEQHVNSWKITYSDWIEDGCPPIVSKFSTVQQKPVPEKKKIRYLNRVDA